MGFYSDDKRFFFIVLAIYNVALAITLFFDMPYQNAIMWFILSPIICGIIVCIRALIRDDRKHVDVKRLIEKRKLERAQHANK